MNTYPFDENGVRDAIKSLHIHEYLGFFSSSKFGDIEILMIKLVEFTLEKNNFSKISQKFCLRKFVSKKKTRLTQSKLDLVGPFGSYEGWNLGTDLTQKHH
jgi:hypothetical protein